MEVTGVTVEFGIYEICLLMSPHFREFSGVIEMLLYFWVNEFGSVRMGYLHRCLRKLVISSYTYAKEK